MRPPADPSLPLHGIRVLDLTIVWAGPFATQILADLGAEVIRVESLQRPDVNTRGQVQVPKAMLAYGPWGAGYPNRDPGERPWERSGIINLNSRNKLSMTLDWTRPHGMDVFRRLFACSDVLIDNNAAGTLEKLGITWEQLSPLNPRMVWVAMPAYGASGPYKYHKGYGANVEALVGHTALRGYTDSDATTTYPVYHADAAAASTAAFATLAALWHRRRSGRGQLIDLSQAECMVHHLSQAVMDYSLNGRSQSTVGNRHAWMAPHDIVPCAGEDRWLAIAVDGDAEWARLCHAIDRDDLVDDARFATLTARRRNQDALRDELSAWSRQHTPIAAMQLLEAAGVRCGALHTAAEVLEDEQLAHRGFFERVDVPGAGVYPFPGAQAQLSETPLHIRRPAPRVGEDNEYLYREVLGVSDEEYAQLVAEEHIGTTYVELRRAAGAPT